MPEAPTKRCVVVVDAADGPHGVALQLPAQATLGMALAAARAQLGTVAADWDHGVAGVWGRVQPRGFCYADGDRVELYRPLLADPKVRRRERSAATGRSARRS